MDGSRVRLATIAGVALLAAAIAIVVQTRAPEKFPTDFPYAWLTSGTITTDPEKVIELRGRAPTGMQQVDGKTLFPAYFCQDPACPDRTRAAGQPVLFPFDLQGDGVQAFSACPACHPPTSKNTDAKPVDPTMVRAYLTPDGERIMRRFATSTEAATR